MLKRDHHYIPQVIIKKWSPWDNKMVLVTNRVDFKVNKISCKSLFVCRDLYEFDLETLQKYNLDKIPGINVDWVENLYGGQENRFSKIISRLSGQFNPTESDLMFLKLFCIELYFRSPEMKEHLSRQKSELELDLPDGPLQFSIYILNFQKFMRGKFILYGIKSKNNRLVLSDRATIGEVLPNGKYSIKIPFTPSILASLVLGSNFMESQEDEESRYMELPDLLFYDTNINSILKSRRYFLR